MLVAGISLYVLFVLYSRGNERLLLIWVLRDGDIAALLLCRVLRCLVGAIRRAHRLLMVIVTVLDSGAGVVSRNFLILLFRIGLRLSSFGVIISIRRVMLIAHVQRLRLLLFHWGLPHHLGFLIGVYGHSYLLMTFGRRRVLTAQSIECTLVILRALLLRGGGAFVPSRVRTLHRHAFGVF